ncbi:MAG: hypothetical protein AAGA37_23830, partial [Actinomycetota bacterium]
SATNYVEFAVFAIEYNLRLAGRETRDERGAVTTETAVIIAILVAIAAAAGITFMARAMSNARAIPGTPAVPDRP